MKRFYLTTTLPYVNAEPHIGFALEIVQADVIARFARARGAEVLFNTGTDEHGLKIYRKAVEEGKDPQAYVDEYAGKFNSLRGALNLTYTNFIRTTDAPHVAAAQEFWRRCAARGDIEKRTYRTKYCVGCELEKTDSELGDGRCPIHPKMDLEEFEEENYFFLFSRYRERLLELYDSRPDFVVPEGRLRETRSFVDAGLHDFSISRLAAKMPWGVPVPGDEAHVMYVWFDALVNYISTLGWPKDEARFNAFWPGLQLAGKDNLRQQSAMWQAMLMSAGLPPSQQIFIHGFINVNGQKMSKSLGNVVDPMALTARFGTDAVRYWLLREMNPFEDGDYTDEKFAARYEADLASGLGNFAARVLALAEKQGPWSAATPVDPEVERAIVGARVAVITKTEAFRFHEALAAVWGLLAFGDRYANEHAPWEGKEGSARIVFNLVVILDNIAAMLAPFLPATAERITAGITWQGGTLAAKKVANLFPRIG